MSRICLARKRRLWDCNRKMIKKKRKIKKGGKPLLKFFVPARR